MKTTHFFLIKVFVLLFFLNDLNAQGSLSNYTVPLASTGGSANTFVGYDAGFATPNPSTNIGTENTGVGKGALRLNTTGNYNCALGLALSNNTTGNSNIGIGYFALRNNQVGNFNIAFGYASLINLTSGNNNLAIGQYAGRNLRSGSNNIIIGSNSIENDLNGSGNVIIGRTSLSSTASDSDTAGNDTTGAIILSSGKPDTPNSFQRIFVNGINGYTGIGLGNNKIPKNRLELNSVGAVAGTSGLRFRGYNSSSSPVASNGRVLTLNTDGDVVLTTDQGSGGSTIINAGANVTVTGTGTPASPYLISSTATNCNLFDCDGTLNTTTAGSPNPGLRTVTMGNNNLHFLTNDANYIPTDPSFGSGRIYIGSALNNFPIFNDNNSHYRLLVEGGILTEKVKIALSNDINNWADYVFEKDYKLMPLSEVEAFVKENNHLPGIDSAKDLVTNGLDIAEMQAKQMGKIEELTLHLIEQNKQLEKQSIEIEELKEQVKLLLNGK